MSPFPPPQIPQFRSSQGNLFLCGIRERCLVQVLGYCGGMSPEVQLGQVKAVVF